MEIIKLKTFNEFINESSDKIFETYFIINVDKSSLKDIAKFLNDKGRKIDAKANIKNNKIEFSVSWMPNIKDKIETDLVSNFGDKFKSIEYDEIRNKVEKQNKQIAYINQWMKSEFVDMPWDKIPEKSIDAIYNLVKKVYK